MLKRLRKLIQPEEDKEEEEDFEDEDFESQDEVTDSGDAEDLEARWQFPYHRDMKLKSLPREVNSGKYVPVYGPYRYDPEAKRKPERNLAPERAAKKKSPLKKKVSANSKEEIHRFKSETVAHNPCPDCSINVGHTTVEVEVLGCKTTVWIPNRRRFDVVRQQLGLEQSYTNDSQTLVPMEVDESGRTTEVQYDSEHLKSWIFTPTHGRAKTGNLNLVHTMVKEVPGGKPTFVSYVHVLVVRQEQFEEYCGLWGSSHVVLRLPLEIPAWYEQHCERSEAECGKVGYARKFIQAFADAYHLGTLFMLDDNILYTYELETATDANGMNVMKREEGKLRRKCVPLYRVLKHLEKLHDLTQDAPEPHKEGYRFTTLEAYTGPPRKYGVLGILRSNKNYRNVKNPFNNVHVSALCFVNVRALREKGIEYQPWEVWEDLHLNNECDAKGLFVVKYNRFAMFKRVMPSALELHCYVWENNPFERRNSKREEVDKKEEVRSLLKYIKSHAPPGRCEVFGGVSEEVTSLVEKVRQQWRSRHHFAALNFNEVEQYLRKTSGLAGFDRHVLAFPIDGCPKNISSYDDMVTRLFDVKPDEEQKSHVVLTSHNVTEFDVHIVLCAINGKGKHFQHASSNPREETFLELRAQMTMLSPIVQFQTWLRMLNGEAFPESSTLCPSIPVKKPNLEPCDEVYNMKRPRVDVNARPAPPDETAPVPSPSTSSSSSRGGLFPSDSDDESIQASLGKFQSTHESTSGSSQNPICIDDDDDEETDMEVDDASQEGVSASNEVHRTLSVDSDTPMDLKPSQSPKAILADVPDASREDSNSSDEQSPSILFAGPKFPSDFSSSARPSGAESSGEESPSILVPEPKFGSITSPKPASGDADAGIHVHRTTSKQNGNEVPGATRGFDDLRLKHAGQNGKAVDEAAHATGGKKPTAGVRADDERGGPKTWRKKPSGTQSGEQ